MQRRIENLAIHDLHLDKDNPRIAPFIEHNRENISEDDIEFALDDSGSSGNTFATLRDAIKASGGLINPIIVNRESSKKLTVIEGNTRLRVYLEFSRNKLPGDWDHIPAIVYDNLPLEDIHAIRLQAHLVGPREWSRYAKAKYLNMLSNEKCMTTSQIQDFCGGKTKGREISAMIYAYQDMENYYRPITDDSGFDHTKFSYFEELQKSGLQKTLFAKKLTKSDFAMWVYTGKINTAQDTRDLSTVLLDERASKFFLENEDTTVRDAMKLIYQVEPNGSSKVLESIPTSALVRTLINRIGSVPSPELKRLAANEGCREVNDYARLQDAIAELLIDISRFANGDY